jgi:demethylmenaquinone methyltransferase / 2-methoxy-6-polyprenyl-1,4-benzoquinol methylase
MPQDSQPWLAQGEGKREAVRGLFAGIASRYDQINGLISLGQHGAWRKKAAAWALVPYGGAALDLCCGTGDFLPPLRKALGPQGSLTGLDFCQPMLDQAAQKEGHRATLVLGDACDLPFTDRSFDVVTVGWGLRNVPDLGMALSEAKRVLKPGGRLVSLDMARPVTPLGKAAERVSRATTPLIGRVFGLGEAYTYLPESAARFLSIEELEVEMKEAGFARVESQSLMMGVIGLHRAFKAEEDPR